MTTTEEVWIRAFCAFVSKGAGFVVATEHADLTLYEFNKRFSKFDKSKETDKIGF